MVDIASHFLSHIFVSEARSNMFRLPAAITLSFSFSNHKDSAVTCVTLTSRLASHVFDRFCRRIESSRVRMLSGLQMLDFLWLENMHLKHCILFSWACWQPSQIRATRINLSPTVRAPGTRLSIVISGPSQIGVGDFPLSDVLTWHIASHLSHPCAHIT